MNDMDVFLYLTHNRKQYPGIPDEAIRQLLTTVFDIPVSVQDIKQFLAQPPTTKQLIHALRDKGFPNQYIQEYLDLAQSTISYHLSTTPQHDYFNRFWSNLRRSWAEQLRKQTTEPD